MGNNPIKSLVFVPPKPCTYTDKEPREVTFVTTIKSNIIPLYYIPCNSRFLFKTDFFASKVELREIKTTILYSHGNAADIGQMDDFLTLLHCNLPVNIVAYDYIGYGLSQPEDVEPSEQNTYESIYAAFSYLRSERNVSQKDMILWGTSLGSGATLELASRGMKFGGIVLECPFTSCCRVVEMVKKNKVIGNVLEKMSVDMFLNKEKIGTVKSPVLLIHGKKDSVVPFVHGEELYEEVDEEYRYKSVWVENADHHNIITTMGTRNYLKEIAGFIEFCCENKNGDDEDENRVKEVKEDEGGWNVIVIEDKKVENTIVEEEEKEEEGKEKEEEEEEEEVEGEENHE